MKKTAFVLVVLMGLILLWGLKQAGTVSILINGQPLQAPFRFLGDVWGLILAGIILFCAAMLLAFVFVGVGLFLLGIFVFVGMVRLAGFFPFLLPLLLPLCLLWFFLSAFAKPKIKP